MSLRFALAATAALTSSLLFSAPAFALQSIRMPDPSASPDAQNAPVLDGSPQNRWQEQKGQDQSGLGKFHFTVNGSSGWGSTSFGENGWSQSPSTYRDPKTPGSEFYQPMPGYNGTMFPQ